MKLRLISLRAKKRFQNVWYRPSEKNSWFSISWNISKTARDIKRRVEEKITRKFSNHVYLTCNRYFQNSPINNKILRIFLAQLSSKQYSGGYPISQSSERIQSFNFPDTPFSTWTGWYCYALRKIGRITMQFVSRERRSSIVGTMIERKRERGREISLKTRSHRRVATPLDGWLHLGENAIWNSAHFPVCRSSSRFRGSLPNVRTRKYLPLIKFTPRNVPTSLPLSHDATPAAIQLLSLLVASTSTHSSPTSLLSSFVPEHWLYPCTEHPLWRGAAGRRRGIANILSTVRSILNNFILREKRIILFCSRIPGTVPGKENLSKIYIRNAFPSLFFIYIWII